jgi:phosphatidate cytidylyltransferase
MTRLLTAVALGVPVCLLIFLAPPVALAAATFLVALLCFREYLNISSNHGHAFAGPLGYAAGAIAMFLPSFDIAAVTMLAMLLFIAALSGGGMENVLPRASLLLFGVIYVFGSWRCGIGLHSINPHWLFFGLAVSWIGDSAAYLAGSLAGRHKLAPTISPHKTWEGAVASVLASVLFGGLYLGYFLPGVPRAEALALAAAANIAGQFGDLCESAVKRGAGIKDSGAMLPGHGGWLDRVDSTLFALPLIYFWLTRFPPPP